MTLPRIQIQVYRTTGSGPPESLQPGELAFSEADKGLYIGLADGNIYSFPFLALATILAANREWSTIINPPDNLEDYGVTLTAEDLPDGYDYQKLDNAPDLDPLQAQVTTNTQALLGLDSVYAALNHSHSNYASTGHNHTLSDYLSGDGRNTLYVRRTANTTSGRLPVLDTDGRCRYFHWSNGSRFAIRVDGSWIFLNPDPSDRRFKRDIRSEDSVENWNAALQGLLNLPLVSYDWDTDNFPVFEGPRINLGVIAQELEAINPGLVMTDPDGFKHVNVSQTIPYLVASIKALAERLQKVEDKLSAE